nr:hypothetical protein Itr_chr05CG19900 [Ipomoea trifida]
MWVPCIPNNIYPQSAHVSHPSLNVFLPPYDSDHLPDSNPIEPADSLLALFTTRFAPSRFFRTVLSFFHNPVLFPPSLLARTLPVQETLGEPGSTPGCNALLPPGADRLLNSLAVAVAALFCRRFPSAEPPPPLDFWDLGRAMRDVDLCLWFNVEKERWEKFFLLLLWLRLPPAPENPNFREKFGRSSSLRDWKNLQRPLPLDSMSSLFLFTPLKPMLVSFIWRLLDFALLLSSSSFASDSL